MQHGTHHGFLAVAAFCRVSDLLGDDAGQHSLFHFHVGGSSIGRSAREFLDQLQTQCQMADRIGAQHLHGLGDRVDMLTKSGIHAAIGQSQHFLSEHGVGQHRACHIEFLLVLTAHGAQNRADGFGKARHVAAPARALPQRGEGGVA